MKNTIYKFERGYSTMLFATLSVAQLKKGLKSQIFITEVSATCGVQAYPINNAVIAGLTRNPLKILQRIPASAGMTALNGMMTKR